MRRILLITSMEDLREYDPVEVGKRLLAVRIAHGLSQAQLIHKCGGGFSVSALSGWENGRQRPKIEYTSKICDVFGLTLDYLLRGKIDSLKYDVIQHLIMHRAPTGKGPPPV